MSYSNPLENIHILIIDNNDTDRGLLTAFLEEKGAKCHPVKNRTEAMGLYVTLFTDNIIPRAIITEWYINPPKSDEHNFYVAIDRPEINTSQRLIERFKIIDPDVDVVIYTSYVDKVNTEDIPVIRKGDDLNKILKILDQSKTVTRYRLTKISSNDVVR